MRAPRPLTGSHLHHSLLLSRDDHHALLVFRSAKRIKPPVTRSANTCQRKRWLSHCCSAPSLPSSIPSFSPLPTPAFNYLSKKALFATFRKHFQPKNEVIGNRNPAFCSSAAHNISRRGQTQHFALRRDLLSLSHNKQQRHGKTHTQNRWYLDDLNRQKCK